MGKTKNDMPDRLFFDVEHLTYPSELWPHSIHEAVELLLVGLTEESKEIITNIPDEFSLVSICHDNLGRYIRNQFGLWNGNNDILTTCGCKNVHPDNASIVILIALWQNLLRETKKKD